MAKKAYVFDWDGTLVSCKEKIDSAIRAIRLDYSEPGDVYRKRVQCGDSSPGWIRRGFIASLSEDYFSYHFGILAQELARSLRIEDDEAWKLILECFKKCYKETASKLLVSPTTLIRLSEVGDVYIVSNSDSFNIRQEAQGHNLDISGATMIGNAKKYKVVSNHTAILGIPVARPLYQSLLQQVMVHHEEVVVIGDNFSLDLATPLSLGLKVAYIPNELSPKSILDYFDGNQMIVGTVEKIINGFS